MDIYVGNLPYSATEEELSELFSSFGPVKRVTIIKDRETGRSKGFGFVVLNDESQVEAAIEAINGAELGGRMLKANGSEPKPRFPAGGERPAGGGGKPPSAGGGKPHKGGDKHHKGGGEKSYNDFDDDFREKRGGKPKGSQKGKRRQKGGYGDDW